MKINVFLKSANDQSFVAPLKYMSNSIKNDGYQVLNVLGNQYKSSDLAIIFGSWKNRDKPHHILKNKIVKFATNFMVIETPILGRGPVSNIMQDKWYRIGLNGFLNNTGNFNNKNCKSDRWEIIKKELNIELNPWRSETNKGPIVIILQLPGDASMFNVDVSNWVNFCVEKIRTKTNRKIILREPQIKRKYNLNHALSFKDVFIQQGTFENKKDILNEAWCTVTFSSGMGVESIISGCPTIAMHPSSFAYEISSSDLMDIENPKIINRNQWIHNLAYTTWSLDEIRLGKPWEHLKPLLANVKKENELI